MPSAQSFSFRRRRRDDRVVASGGGADRGQATPLLIGVVAIAAVSLIPIARLGRAASDAARARAAADAAALAGVVDGPAAARHRAADNGGTLITFVHLGSDIVVTVRVGDATAKARATLNGDAPNTLGDRGLDRPPG